MSAQVGGYTKDWLAAKREELNARFKLAARRFSGLDGNAALALLADLLPPLAGDGGPGANELLDALYDLVLLHAGRGLLGHESAQQGTFATMLFRETFPKARSFLLEQPSFLPAALSNAAESMGAQGPLYARAVAALCDAVSSADELKRAAAVAAWRLGEARLRETALEYLAALPPRAALTALRLKHWPDEAAPLASAALSGDAWHGPEAALSSQTLERLPKLAPPEREALRVRLAERKPSRGEWTLAGRLGDFTGFGGAFDEPPLLLDAGARATRHCFWALSTEGIFRIDADAYGWRCRADRKADLPTQEVKAKPGKLGALLKGKPATPQLYADGTYSAAGQEEQIPQAAGATSFAAPDGALFYTRRDSFRVRVLVLPRASV